MGVATGRETFQSPKVLAFSLLSWSFSRFSSEIWLVIECATFMLVYWKVASNRGRERRESWRC
jgi:hypothetical protein